MVALLAAFQFLTIFPPIIRRVFTPQELGRSVGWYPTVGLALGGTLCGLESSLRLFLPPQVTAVLALAAWLVLTRALHFDGFLDTCDGLFGGFTPERRLEIMRDSRVGALGVAGGILLALAKYVFIFSLTDRLAGFLLAPVLGRWVIALAIYACPYGREKGLGRDIKDNTRWPQAALATGITLALAWLIGGWRGLIAWAAAGLLFVAGARYVLRLIPGLTGDIYGALCEVIETSVLVLFTVKWPLI